MTFEVVSIIVFIIFIITCAFIFISPHLSHDYENAYGSPYGGYNYYSFGGAEDHFPPSVVQLSRKMAKSWGVLDYGKFEIANDPPGVTLYSSLMPWHIRDQDAALLDATESFDIKTITDMTSHIGADSANFSKLFPKAHITSIEINPAYAAILKRNLGVFNRHLKRDPALSTVLVSDAATYIDGNPKASDLVYFDPPWNQSRAVPSLGDRKMPDIVRNEFKRGAKVVVVKTPRESNINELTDQVGRKFKTYTVNNAKSDKVSYYLVVFN